MNITGCRRSATGVFGYEYYENNQLLCSLNSLVLPDPPVYIRGMGLELVSEFDRDMTIVPGSRRAVTDRWTGETLFHLVYRNRGQFDILFSSDHVIRVFAADDLYLFRFGPGQVAEMARLTDSRAAAAMECPPDLEPYFRALLPEQLEPEEILAILSFPMLKFAF